MKRLVSLLFLLGFFISMNAWAAIYCPEKVICKDKKCQSIPSQNPVFNNFSVSLSTEIPDGTFYFAMARFSSYSMNRPPSSCNYASTSPYSTGHWIILSASKILIPDYTLPSEWDKSDIPGDCRAISPQSCPFKG